MEKILYVLMSASIAYLVLFIIAKLLGKKQIAELDFIDYVTGISIGSIAAEMSFNVEQPFYLYLIAMGLFFLFDLIVTILARKANWLKRFLRGTPLVLISQGEINFHAIKKSKIDIFDLLTLARAKGYFDLSEIEYAILETNGELSILAKDNSRDLKKQDFPEIPPSKPSLTYYIIVDKQVNKFALKETNKTKTWVLKQLSQQNIKLKEVMYATYDDKNDTIDVTTF